MPARKGTMSEKDSNIEVEEDATKEVTEDLTSESDIADTTLDEEYDSRKVDPKEELWPEGPNFGQINEWKDHFGDVYVTSITPSDHVVWRTMTRFEYRNLMRVMEQAMASGQKTSSEANLDNEESIAELCVIHPKYHRTDGASILGGLASTVAQQVMEASGFTSVEVRQL